MTDWVKDWHKYLPQQTGQSNTRIEICLKCDSLEPKFRKCRECGCYMDLKTRLKNSKCLLGKW